MVKAKWGFELRPYQKRAVLHALQAYIEGMAYNNHFVCTILPTGAGKSVIFQSVAVVLNEEIGGVTVVFSPLRALIEDQVRSLRRRGIEVCKIDGTVSSKEKERCLKKALRGEVKLIYMTPEQLRTPLVKKYIDLLDINFIVFDEVHTLTKWGMSFRPAYLMAAKMIKERREKGKWLPLLAFTATLPQDDLKLILENLGVDSYEKLELPLNKFDKMEELPPKPRILEGPVLRENLLLEGEKIVVGGKRNKDSKKDEIIRKERLERLYKTVRELSEWSGKISENWVGLVFVPFVRSSHNEENVNYVAEYLDSRLEEGATAYHGQMEQKEKEKILEEIYAVSEGKREKPRVVVATKAFGMGIDIPNIRWVVHLLMSESIEDYYQEIGRAGRDQKLARTKLLFAGEYDFRRRYNLLRRSLLKSDFVIKIWKKLKYLSEILGDEFVIPLELLLEKDGSRINDDEEVKVERTLHILSITENIDYDIYTGRPNLCDDGFPSLPLSDGKPTRLCFGGTGPKFTGIVTLPRAPKREPKIIKVTKNKFYYIIILNKELKYDKINEIVSKFNYLEVKKLESAMMLGSLIASGQTSAAKKIIEDYLKSGIEKFAEIEERKKQISLVTLKNMGFELSIKRNGIKAYKTISDNMTYENLKAEIGKVIALAIAYALTELKLPPDMVVVFVTRSYVKATKEGIDWLQGLFDEKGIYTMLPKGKIKHMGKQLAITELNELKTKGISGIIEAKVNLNKNPKSLSIEVTWKRLNTI